MKMARKTTRLYYGLDKTTGEKLYWTLKVRNATRPVKLNGTVMHAMTGKAGVSIGCHMSNVGMDNIEAFGHPCLFLSFTKSVALAITKIKNGAPAECVRYRHKYGNYVDLNDKEPDKATVKMHPEFFNRQFTLGVYKDQKPHWKPRYGREVTGERSKNAVMRGELARLKAAGLVLQDIKG